MGDFDDIRQMTMESIRTNRENVNIMRNWKEEIRGTLMEVRNEFMNLIDDYTDKFVQSLRDVDQSSELAVYAGEDKRQQQQILEMERKHATVNKIFQDILGSPEEKKVDLIINLQPQMERIRVEVQN